MGSTHRNPPGDWKITRSCLPSRGVMSSRLSSAPVSAGNMVFFYIDDYEPPHLSAELSAGPREIPTRLLRAALVSGCFFQCAQTMYPLVSAFDPERVIHEQPFRPEILAPLHMLRRVFRASGFPR
jgi:hypothetical protein